MMTQSTDSEVGQADGVGAPSFPNRRISAVAESEAHATAQHASPPVRVEAADTAPGGRAIRDSKEPARPMLTFDPNTGHGFLGGAKSEGFGRSSRG